MRALATLAAVLGIIAAACGGGGAEPLPPNVTPAPTDAPSALEIWARAVAASEGALSVTEKSVLVDLDTGAETPYAERIDKTSRNGDRIWPHGDPLPYFPGTLLDEKRPASLTNMRLLGTEARAGERFWVLAFNGSDFGIDAGREYAAKVWITRDTYLIKRMETTTIKSYSCCGEPPKKGDGTPSVYEYTDFVLGTPLPTPSPTPSPIPPVTPGPRATTEPPQPPITIRPLAGPCNDTVVLSGRSLEPGAHVSVYGGLAFISEGGEVEAEDDPAGTVDVQGNIEMRFRLAGGDCASPTVAIWQPIDISVHVNWEGGGFQMEFDYFIEPCAPNTGRYCLTPPR